MLIRPNIVNMFHELNAKHFNNEIPTIPVVWNTRMTTTAGRCHLEWDKDAKRDPFYGRSIKPTKIDLSDKLFRNNDYDEEKIRRTMIHEMVHAYLAHKFNDRGHSYAFHNMMDDITGEYKNHRCHNYNVKGLKRQNEKKIKCVCTRCGYEYRKARMPKYAAYSTYTHRYCGGAIEFTVDKKEDEGKISIF